MSLNKISSQDWFKIGLSNGWLNEKKAQVDFKLPIPGLGGNSNAGSGASTGASGASGASANAQSTTGMFSSLGVSEFMMASMLLKKKNPGMSLAEVQLAAQNLAVDHKRLLQEAYKAGFITKDQMKNILSGKVTTVGFGAPAASNKLKNVAKGAIGVGGALGGYFGTEALFNSTINQRRGFNVASPSVIKQRAGSITEFKRAGLILINMGRSVAGISKTLDTAFTSAGESYLELVDQLLKNPK